MATYNAPNYSNNWPMPYHGQANQVQCLLNATVTLTAAPTTSDTINFGYLPPNAIVTGMVSVPSDMDTGGSPSLTLDLGISGTAQLFLAAGTGGQTGTASNSIAAAGIGYKTTAKTLVVGTAHANAATGAAGTWQVMLFGFIDDPKTSG